ncbi:hypothetical protein [Candidatus Frankia alpina]|uniref:hypothetical protein n=1 Tax=Candidatus Frankia alpina TaxID=2699483 RepID=UPI0013D509F8|nr:hypothetical protein [Candidatus Frankia alpina]
MTLDADPDRHEPVRGAAGGVVVGVTGHRGLTGEQARYVAAQAHRLLAPLVGTGFAGITCLAEGADTVVADVILTLGGRLISVIPADGYRDFQPPGHRRDFDRLLRCSAEVVRQDRPTPDLASLMAASRVLVDASDQIIAVWDGLPTRGWGGTADVVEYAREQHRPVQIIWPAGAVRRPMRPGAQDRPRRRPAGGDSVSGG